MEHGLRCLLFQVRRLVVLVRFTNGCIHMMRVNGTQTVDERKMNIMQAYCYPILYMILVIWCYETMAHKKYNEA